MQWLLKKIIGTKNERDIKKVRPLVARVNELEEELQALSDSALQEKSMELRARLSDGESVASPSPETAARPAALSITTCRFSLSTMRLAS